MSQSEHPSSASGFPRLTRPMFWFLLICSGTLGAAIGFGMHWYLFTHREAPIQEAANAQVVNSQDPKPVVPIPTAANQEAVIRGTCRMHFVPGVHQGRCDPENTPVPASGARVVVS